MISSNIKKIQVNGTNTLNGATIITNNDNDNNTNNQIFEAFIEGENDETYEIYCSKSNVCFIYCLSPQSCTKLNLYCIGDCSIYCSSNNNTDQNYDIDCINNIIGNYTIISSFYNNNQTTTNTTSTTTSVKPSLLPSYNPSYDPSYNPSYIPSYIPTVIPTINASITPTIIPTHPPSTTPSTTTKTIQ